MTIDEIETQALRLSPDARARLAAKLLESLEHLSDQENARLWAEEAQRRDEAWDSETDWGRSAVDVFRGARDRLG